MGHHKGIVRRRVSACAALLAMLLVSFLTQSVWCASAATAIDTVDSSRYQLEIRHDMPTLLQRDEARGGLQLHFTVANNGPQKLYDLRFFLIRAGSVPIALRNEPARIHVLPIGSRKEVTWTFEVGKVAASLPTRDVWFRVEAVDQSTQKIVAFNQQSMEGR